MGHSNTTDAVTFADRAGADRLVLFHHDPLHTDDDLEAMLADARGIGAPVEIELGHEGQSFALAPP